MYGTGTKKSLNLMILQILKKHTDENHSLTQQQIIKYLDSEYGMECDRRSVKSNVLSLKEMGDEIDYDIDMSDGYRISSREFDDAELRILIDSVLFSKSISKNQAKTLIDKIKKLSSKHFKAKVSHVSNCPELHRTINKQAMYSLDAINDAISERKKISFVYNEIGTDLKLHPRKDHEYIVNPYQIVANNGRFYLICNTDKYDNISHYRIDRMTDVRILQETIKPMKKVQGMEHGLNLPKHMAEHIYMFSGESVDVIMRVDKSIMTELVDWFGTDFRIIEEKEKDIKIRLRMNPDAMKYWALQYGYYAEVLEPVELREQIKDRIAVMAQRYK